MPHHHPCPYCRCNETDAATEALATAVDALLVQYRARWTGTAKDLGDALGEPFPPTGQGIGRALARASAALDDRGINVRHHKARGIRLITFTRR